MAVAVAPAISSEHLQALSLEVENNPTAAALEADHLALLELSRVTS